ncbi:MAG: glycogen synthase GlgA [Chloroflexota bacterium]
MMQTRVTRPNTKLDVVMVTPEASPFAKTGGLGDVLGALPGALEQLGATVSLVMPAYHFVLHGAASIQETGISFTVPVSDRKERAIILKSSLGRNVSVYFVRNDKYFDREYLYGTSEGDYADNAERFVFFNRAALELVRMSPPRVLHCHDWQAALSVAFLKSQPSWYPELASVKTVMTVHNLGYQGLFGYPDWHLLNLDPGLFTARYLEFYSRMNFLKGGLVFADAITTMSPSYAEEIKTTENGFGLDGVFRERAAQLVGILNGVDYDIWNPENDHLIARQYGLQNLAGKKACKTDVQRSLGLAEEPDVPLIGMVSRLAGQKGLDLIETAFDKLLSRKLQFVLLGSGDMYYEDFFRQAAARYPGKAAARVTFNEAVAHQIVAGADILLMPSRYEPGGLTQIYGMKYGTVPIVRATGGLKDTVTEFDPATGQGTGFLFIPYTADAFLAAVGRTLACFRKKRQWAKLIKNTMTADFSWSRSAEMYLKLYRKLLND